MTSAEEHPEPPSAPGLELRILAGRHAGAVVALQAAGPGAAASLSIGPGLDHDIVLSDAAGSATLTLSDAGWVWSESDFNASLAEPGRWRWGTVQMAIGPAGSPWEHLPERFDRSVLRTKDDQAEEPAAAQTGATATDSHSQPDETARAAALPESAAASGPADFPVANRSSGGSWSGAVVLVTAAIIAIGWMVLPRQSAAPSPQSPVQATVVSTPPDAGALTSLLAASGFGEQVRVVPQPDGRLRLIGVVAEDEDLDRLLKRVTSITRRIVLGVLTQQEFALRVRELQSEVPVPVALRVVPVGRIFVVEDEDLKFDKSVLERWLQKVLPETLNFAVVARNALTEIIAEVAPHTPEEPEPQAPPMPQALPDLPPDEAPFPPLPAIRLVVSGRAPYLMLASGEKWLPGGRVGGWTLWAVEPDAFVIEDVRGRRVRSPR